MCKTQQFFIITNLRSSSVCFLESKALPSKFAFWFTPNKLGTTAVTYKLHRFLFTVVGGDVVVLLQQQAADPVQDLSLKGRFLQQVPRGRAKVGRSQHLWTHCLLLGSDKQVGGRDG